MKVQFVIETTWSKASIRSVRLVLKRLLRTYGLRCLTIDVVEEEAKETDDAKE